MLMAGTGGGVAGAVAEQGGGGGVSGAAAEQGPRRILPVDGAAAEQEQVCPSLLSPLSSAVYQSRFVVFRVGRCACLIETAAKLACLIDVLQDFSMSLVETAA